MAPIAPQHGARRPLGQWGCSLRATGPRAGLPIQQTANRHFFGVSSRSTQDLSRATIHVSGLGQYELYVNGQKVGEDVLSPGWTKYDKTVLYDTRDVTALLRPGTNAIGLMLGKGMYRVDGGRYTKFKGSFGRADGDRAASPRLCGRHDETRSRPMNAGEPRPDRSRFRASTAAKTTMRGRSPQAGARRRSMIRHGAPSR